MLTYEHFGIAPGNERQKEDGIRMGTDLKEISGNKIAGIFVYCFIN